MAKKRAANMTVCRREQIMAAAMTEFANHPYQTASLNEIIRASGISKGVVYYYFDSKDDLYLTVLRSCLDALTVPVKETMEGTVRQNEGFWAPVAGWLLEIGGAMSASPLKALFLHAVIDSSTRGEETPAKSLIREIDEWLSDRLVEGQIIGAVRRDIPLELLAQMVWGMVRTLLGWFVADIKAQRSYDVEKSVLTLVDTLKRLCVPQAVMDSMRPGATSREMVRRSPACSPVETSL